MYNSIVIVVGTNKYILNYNANEDLSDIEGILLDNVEDNEIDIESANEAIEERFDSHIDEYREDSLTIEE